MTSSGAASWPRRWRARVTTHTECSSVRVPIRSGQRARDDVPGFWPCTKRLGRRGRRVAASQGEGRARPEVHRRIQHFTEPPPRYTEATLIKDLEDKASAARARTRTSCPSSGPREYVEKEEGACARPHSAGKYGKRSSAFPGSLRHVVHRSDGAKSLTRSKRRVHVAECGEGFLSAIQGIAEHLDEKKTRLKSELQENRRQVREVRSTPHQEVGRNGQFLACPRTRV
jgi:hypothetical protein